MKDMQPVKKECRSGCLARVNLQTIVLSGKKKKEHSQVCSYLCTKKVGESYICTCAHTHNICKAIHDTGEWLSS